MLLEGKTAVVFGAAGYLGRHISTRFVAEGAQVFAAGSKVSGMQAAATLADTTEVDTTDEQGVNEVLDAVVAKSGKLDIVVNLAAVKPAAYHHGHPASEVSLAQFLQPFWVDTAGQFVTAKAAYGHMAKQGHGVVIFSSSTLAKAGAPWAPAATAAHAATEGLMRSLAHEWGPAGVRVLGVRSEAMPDSPTIDYTFKTMGQNIGLGFDEMRTMIEQSKTALKQLPSGEDTAGVFAFAASDLASMMAGTMINQSAGHITD